MWKTPDLIAVDCDGWWNTRKEEWCRCRILCTAVCYRICVASASKSNENIHIDAIKVFLSVVRCSLNPHIECTKRSITQTVCARGITLTIQVNIRNEMFKWHMNASGIHSWNMRAPTSTNSRNNVFKRTYNLLIKITFWCGCAVCSSRLRFRYHFERYGCKWRQTTAAANSKSMC